MSTLSTSPETTNASNQQHQAHVVREGADGLESFTYQHRPTGADILKSAGRPVDADQVVMQILRGGGLEDVRLDEAVKFFRSFIGSGPPHLFGAPSETRVITASVEAVITLRTPDRLTALNLQHARAKSVDFTHQTLSLDFGEVTPWEPHFAE